MGEQVSAAGTVCGAKASFFHAHRQSQVQSVIVSHSVLLHGCDMTELVQKLVDVHLSDRTSLGLGGAAASFYAVGVDEELMGVLQKLNRDGEPFGIIGGGSNLVVSDEGIEGSLISLRRNHRFERLSASEVLVEGGEDWDDFVAWTVRQGLGGAACLSGIPGSVGAAPIQNIGAYGEEVSEIIKWVEIVNLDNLKRLRLNREACQFSYRDSIFKRALRGRAIVTRVLFELNDSDVVRPKYKELRDRLGSSSNLTSARESVLEIREKKGMVLGHPFGFSSAGSFFTNPILSPLDAEVVKKRLSQSVNVPSWRLQDGTVKLAAAWLIEQAGFKKGMRFGNVGVSPKHALSLVNFGGGSTRNLLNLAVEIQQTVFERFNVWLTMEPEMLGVGLDSFKRLKREKPQ